MAAHPCVMGASRATVDKPLQTMRFDQISGAKSGRVTSRVNVEDSRNRLDRVLAGMAAGPFKACVDG